MSTPRYQRITKNKTDFIANKIELAAYEQRQKIAIIIAIMHSDTNLLGSDKEILTLLGEDDRELKLYQHATKVMIDKFDIQAKKLEEITRLSKEIDQSNPADKKKLVAAIRIALSNYATVKQIKDAFAKEDILKETYTEKVKKEIIQLAVTALKSSPALDDQSLADDAAEDLKPQASQQGKRAPIRVLEPKEPEIKHTALSPTSIALQQPVSVVPIVDVQTQPVVSFPPKIEKRLEKMKKYQGPHYALAVDYVMPMAIAFAMRNGATEETVKSQIIDPKNYFWLEHAKKALQQTRFLRLEHYFAMKENPTAEKLMYDHVLPLFQNFGTLFEARIALGNNNQVMIDETAQWLLTLATQLNGHVDYEQAKKGVKYRVLYDDLDISSNLERESKQQSVETIRAHYESMIKDLMVLYRQASSATQKEVKSASEAYRQVAEGTDPFQIIRRLEQRLIMTLKDLRKTYPKGENGKRPPLEEKILDQLPFGTKMQWQCNLFKKKKEETQSALSSSALVELLDLSKIEEVQQPCAVENEEGDAYRFREFGHF